MRLFKFIDFLTVQNLSGLAGTRFFMVDVVAVNFKNGENI